MKPSTENILDIITLSRLTGPIFDKELRVSSRRKRYYFLRTAYLGILIIFTTFIWTINIQINAANSVVLMASRMAIVGIATVSTIAWLQFIVAQILAGVLLSTAISEEIYKNTLAVLMTTPITGFQIVVGKILSKLLLVILLLAVSFPLLAILRVFGGIPWDFVILSFCVTVTAALFTGSLSLFLSIFTRKSHNVLIQLVIILGVLYGVVPAFLIIATQTYSLSVPPFIMSAMYNCNPFAVMGIYTESAVNSTPPAMTIDWLAHCAIMFGGSVVLTLCSVLAVSKIRFHSSPSTSYSILQTSGKIRPINRHPVIWKELNSTSGSHRRILKLAGMVLAIIAIIAGYTFCIVTKAFDSPQTHVAFVLGYLLLALLRTSVISSASITSEKEARTWPILLSTPLDKKEIAKGKIIASAIRAWPFWVLVALHLLIFTSLRRIHPFALIPLAILFPMSAITTSSIGVFISSCCRRTSFATVINMVVFFVCIVPMCCVNPLPFAGPMFITGIIVAAASASDVAGSSFWTADFIVNIGLNEFLISSGIFLGIMLVYLLIAYVCYAVTQANIRSKIF